MTSASDEKWRHFNCFFNPRTGVSSTGPDPENRVGDQDTGSPGRSVSSGLLVPGEPGHCRGKNKTPWWPYRSVFPSKCPSIAPDQQRWVILRVDSLVLWKIINEERAVLIPKKSRRRIFQRIFALGNFWQRDEQLCRQSSDCSLSPGHSDITRFRPWSPIATGNHLDRA